MNYCNIHLKKLRALKFSEKRVFRVETVSDIDNVNEYIRKAVSKFKKRQLVYDSKGRINYRFNILKNDEDIWIPVRSNTVAFQ